MVASCHHSEISAPGDPSDAQAEYLALATNAVVRQRFAAGNTRLAESIHIQQAAAGSIRGSAGTLLEQAITEGSADFLGELVSNGIINGKIYGWALPRESALWADFKNEMSGQDVSRWLYNQRTATLIDLAMWVISSTLCVALTGAAIDATLTGALTLLSMLAMAAIRTFDGRPVKNTR